MQITSYKICQSKKNKHMPVSLEMIGPSATNYTHWLTRLCSCKNSLIIHLSYDQFWGV